MRLAIALVSVILALAGCGLLPAPQPDWITNRLPLDSCGVEDLTSGDMDMDVAARTCLLTAFQDGRGAELILTRLTIEGDPVTSYLRVHENGTVEQFVDATRDSYGSGEWERFRCERLVPVSEANDPPDLVYPDDMVFVDDGCEPLPVP